MKKLKKELLNIIFFPAHKHPFEYVVIIKFVFIISHGI